VKYQARYLPALEVPGYLQGQGLKANYVNRRKGTVQTYRPEGELIVAISGDSPIEVNWLRNLAISPPDCYQQVLNRWDEFALKTKADGRCDDDN
jgi:hypothetical protein